MKKSLSILGIFVAMVMMVTMMAGCSPDSQLQKYTDKLNSQFANAKSIVHTVTTHDGDVKVHQVDTITDLSSDEATVEVVTQQLGSSFQLETSSQSRVENKADINTDLPLTLKADLLEDFVIKGNDLNATVTGSKVGKVLGLDNFIGDGQLTILSTSDATTINYVMTAVSGRTITVTVIYTY